MSTTHVDERGHGLLDNERAVQPGRPRQEQLQQAAQAGRAHITGKGVRSEHMSSSEETRGMESNAYCLRLAVMSVAAATYSAITENQLISSRSSLN